MTKKLFGITFLIFLFGGCSNISKEGIKEDGRPVSEMKSIEIRFELST